MSDDIKPSEIYDDIYVATITGDNKVILKNRNYAQVAEILDVDEIAGFLLDGVCVCQRREHKVGEKEKFPAVSYWFCLDKNTNKRATAEYWDIEGLKQVVMTQPDSCCDTR